MPKFMRLSIAVLFAALASGALAQDHPGRGAGDRPGGDRPNRQEQGDGARGEPGSETNPRAPGVVSWLPADSVTEHSIDRPNGKLAYTATAGTFSLFDQSGSRSASIFYTAYVAKTDNPAPRPVTFVFNGGPGAGSDFLNHRLVGQRI